MAAAVGGGGELVGTAVEQQCRPRLLTDERVRTARFAFLDVGDEFLIWAFRRALFVFGDEAEVDGFARLEP